MLSDICFLSARELARIIRAKELSAREAVEAHLAQVSRLNPVVNAIVTLTPERALEAARAADEALAAGRPPGPLHGLPVAHKDLIETRGIRTTFGSPIYADNIPERDALIVERLRAAGAITIGKTNTPEFGAGSQTFNPVFGATHNPWDLTKTCGGSSGGAAVALACGMVPLADGSDVGGSLRNPAAWCNVTGFRTTPGRVPVWPSPRGWDSLGVEGPMARDVADAALMLSAIVGPDPRSPIALEAPGATFAAPLERAFRGVRVAWSRDLGGLPIDPRITAVLERQRATFAALGCEVEDAEPDFAGADHAFKVLRAAAMTSRAPLLRSHRDQMKATVVWNIEQGLALSAEDVAAAEAERTALYHRVRAFFERYDYLLCPVTQVPPFDLGIEYPTEINGEPMHTYIDWMRACSFISATGHPAMSVPAGFTDEGLPVGIQVVGRYREDFAVLQLAHAFEQAAGFARQRPPLAAATP